MGKRKNTNIQTIVHKTVHRKYLSVFRQEYICLCSDKNIFVCVPTRIYLSVFRQEYIYLCSDKNIFVCVPTSIYLSVFRQEYICF